MFAPKIEWPEKWKPSRATELRLQIMLAHAERDELDRKRDELSRAIYAANDELWAIEHPGEPAPRWEDEVPF